MNNLHNLGTNSVVIATLAALLLSAVRFGGRFIGTIWLWLTGTLQRNQQAQQEYTTTLAETVSALQTRVSLLEKWRDEAAQLEQEVKELKAQLQEAKDHYESELRERDAEINRLSEELTKAQSDLAAAHAKIRRLEKQVGDTVS